MSEPFILNAGAVGVIHTYENESVYIDIKASCAEAIVDDTAIDNPPTEEERRAASERATDHSPRATPAS